MLENEVVLSAEEQLKILRLPTKVRGTYVIWLMGFNPYFLMSRETFYRHKRELEFYGVDISKQKGLERQTK